MQIDIPDNLIEQANRLAHAGEDASAVIARAVARLAQEEREVAAVQQGIDDHEAGRSRPYDEFATEFLSERGITPER